MADELESNGEGAFPVRGLHVGIHGRGDIASWERFIEEVLPREGVNALVVEVNYHYAYRSYPQVAEQNPLTSAEIKRLLAACRKAGVEMIPQINCLGHQSWAGRSHGLLRAFPEFDERPDIPQDVDNKAIYCRSWCPKHPKVHEVVFALVNELADVCEAQQFHVGMDEVFLIAEDKCPRCRGEDAADLFAGEVTALADHLAESGRTMWMWGDRLINAAEWATGRWSGSENETWRAVDCVPKDIVICDWHYEKAVETPAFFVQSGFAVVASPWQKEDVALAELDIMRRVRRESDRVLGMLQTSWCGFDSFVRAYDGELDPNERRNRDALGAARCFRTLFGALRGTEQR